MIYIQTEMNITVPYNATSPKAINLYIPGTNNAATTKTIKVPAKSIIAIDTDANNSIGLSSTPKANKKASNANIPVKEILLSKIPNIFFLSPIIQIIFNNRSRYTSLKLRKIPINYLYHQNIQYIVFGSGESQYTCEEQLPKFEALAIALSTLFFKYESLHSFFSRFDFASLIFSFFTYYYFNQKTAITSIPSKKACTAFLCLHYYISRMQYQYLYFLMNPVILMRDGVLNYSLHYYISFFRHLSLPFNNNEYIECWEYGFCTLTLNLVIYRFESTFIYPLFIYLSPYHLLTQNLYRLMGWWMDKDGERTCGEVIKNATISWRYIDSH